MRGWKNKKFDDGGRTHATKIETRRVHCTYKCGLSWYWLWIFDGSSASGSLNWVHFSPACGSKSPNFMSSVEETLSNQTNRWNSYSPSYVHLGKCYITNDPIFASGSTVLWSTQFNNHWALNAFRLGKLHLNRLCVLRVDSRLLPLVGTLTI